MSFKLKISHQKGSKREFQALVRIPFFIFIARNTAWFFAATKCCHAGLCIWIHSWAEKWRISLPSPVSFNFDARHYCPQCPLPWHCNLLWVSRGEDVAQLVEHQTGMLLVQARFFRRGEGFFSQSYFQCRLSYMCLVHPCVQLPALTSVCTLKIL